MMHTADKNHFLKSYVKVCVLLNRQNSWLDWLTWLDTWLWNRYWTMKKRKRVMDQQYLRFSVKFNYLYCLTYLTTLTATSSFEVWINIWNSMFNRTGRNLTTTSTSTACISFNNRDISTSAYARPSPHNSQWENKLFNSGSYNNNKK